MAPNGRPGPRLAKVKPSRLSRVTRGRQVSVEESREAPYLSRMSPEDAIEERLRTKQGLLAKLDRERETLLIEIKTYLDALGLVRGQTSQTDPSPKKSRQRGLSSHWKAILAYLAADSTKPFGYDDVFIAASLAEVDITRGAARTKMMSFVDDGLIERVSDGQFRVTPKGADAAGIVPKREGPDVAASGPSTGLIGVQRLLEEPATKVDPFRRDLLSGSSVSPMSPTFQPPLKG